MTNHEGEPQGGQPFAEIADLMRGVAEREPAEGRPRRSLWDRLRGRTQVGVPPEIEEAQPVVTEELPPETEGAVSFTQEPQDPSLASEEAQTPVEEKKSWSRKQKFGAAVGALALVGAGVGLLSQGGKKTPTGGDASGGAGKGAVPANVIEALTVKQSEVDCSDIVGRDGIVIAQGREVVRFNIGALKPVAEKDGRLWSDAMSTPLTEKQGKDAMFKEIEQTVCEDPLIGATVANEFANMTVGGVKIIDLNPWLRGNDYVAKINNNAESFVPLLNKTGIVSDTEAMNAVERNLAYQQLAEKLVTLLTRFKNNGEQILPTIANYHLVAGGLKAVGLPEVELNPEQYTGSQLVLTLDEKDGSCLIQIGFNTKDRRPVILSCSIIPKSPKTRTPTTTNSVSPKHQMAPIDGGQDSGPGAGGTPGPRGTQEGKPTPPPTPTSSASPNPTNPPNPNQSPTTNPNDLS